MQLTRPHMDVGVLVTGLLPTSATGICLEGKGQGHIAYKM